MKWIDAIGYMDQTLTVVTETFDPAHQVGATTNNQAAAGIPI